jgi:RND family efflux transporter MFP subunit
MDSRVRVIGHGTVSALREAGISTQVPGQVAWRAPNMLEGGFFKRGEAMFRIEAEDFRLKVEMARAQVALAEKELQIARANSHIAEQEWQIMKKLSAEPQAGERAKIPSALVLFKPQLKSAEAAFAAAVAERSQAELNLARTTIVAPFNCFIAEKSFDEGQYVTVGQTAARVLGTDAVEVVVPVSLEDKRWIQLGLQQRREDIDAVVSIKVGETVLKWDGKVDRILGDVEPRGRMHRVVVRVNKPYFEDEEQSKPRPLPLSVGMFAQVEISSAMMRGVIRIPRTALRENSTVWIADPEDRLEMRQVQIERLTSEHAFLREGLAPGERIILSNFTGAANGIALRATELSPGAEVLP